MDTFYFRRNYGVMVFRDAYLKRNLFRQYVKYETIALYKQGISYLQSQGWDVVGIVCDGRRGIFQAFPHFPIQMCHYHQQAIITRYLTRNPRLEAGLELKQLASLLTTSDKESWCNKLLDWHDKWKLFLKEKTYNPETNRWHYTHRRFTQCIQKFKEPHRVFIYLSGIP